MIVIDLSPQEAFDKVKTHLLTQNGRSVDPILGKCRYRGQNNTMCAVGCLIPNDQYTDKLEGQSIDTLTRIGAISVPNKTTCVVLQDLQSIHDHTDIKVWSQRLRDLARRFKLEYKEGE